MSVLVTAIRKGAYADSIVLMQLQSDLQRLEGVEEAGVVMATAVNLDLLAASNLADSAARRAGADDLVIAIRADSTDQANAALAQVDSLMQSRKTHTTGDFRPRALASAVGLLPEARWVSISIPGRWAHTVAGEALDLELDVFLYSDNVDEADERALKRKASDLGRLVMGPDCGSAIVGGVGFGFTNAVRSGPIGLVCASGTGLQAITSQIHQSGSGVSHAIGTGGRDLSAAVGGSTTSRALALLAEDNSTQVIVLTSKPPDGEVSARVLAQALSLETPVVVYFSGAAAPVSRLGNVHFATSLTDAAAKAVSLAKGEIESHTPDLEGNAEGGHLRGLFAGGTLALEAMQAALPFLSPLHSNLTNARVTPLTDPTVSIGHTILDLGADEYTVGRLHPMMDPRLRNERLLQEASDPTTGLILLDVVLGRGAEPDPAETLVPLVEEIESSRDLAIVVLLVGTNADPQNLERTSDRLAAAGARVYTEVNRGLAEAIGFCVPIPPSDPTSEPQVTLEPPTAAINVGLESFYEDLLSQDLDVLQVDWSPPAGGNERLMAILEKMKR